MSVPQSRLGAPRLAPPYVARPGVGRPPGPAAPPLRLLDRPARRLPRLASRPRWMLAAGGVVICVVLLGVVAAHAMLAQSQLRLDRLDQRLASEFALHQRLELQVAQLSSPTRILSVAQQQLHMVVPSSVTYLHSGTGHSGTKSASTGPAHTSSSTGRAGTGTSAASGR